MQLNREFVWPAVVAVSTVAVAVSFAADLGPPLAPIVAFWFAFVCPGLPFARLLNLREPLTEMLLAVALSWAVIAVAGLGLMLAGVWSAVLNLQIVVGITMVGLALDVAHITASRRKAEAPA